MYIYRRDNSDTSLPEIKIDFNSEYHSGIHKCCNNYTCVCLSRKLFKEKQDVQLEKERSNRERT